MAAWEARAVHIGQELWQSTQDKRPGLFDKAWWSGQIIEWAMQDPAFKTEMLRFIDVFPALADPEAIGRHMQAYLLRPGLQVPAAIRLILKGAHLNRLTLRLATGQIAKNLEGMARSFIVGTQADEAAPVLEKLWRQGQCATVDLLGEATVSDAEGQAYVQRALALLEGLVERSAQWPAQPTLERDARGPIPRVNLSVKLSALLPGLDPLASEHNLECTWARLLPLAERARALGAALTLDAEQYAIKDLNLALFERLCLSPQLRDWPHLGIAVQAYLRDAPADVQRLLQLAKRRAVPFTVRLVKGAYWDQEVLEAHREGWPAPVWLHKASTDACFEQLTAQLLSAHRHLNLALASHNVRSLAVGLACAEHYQVPPESFEIQGLYGMGEPIRAACAARGLRVRAYAPVGDLLPGMAYLVRRLLENTSNQGWLRLGYAEERPIEELLAPPAAPEEPETLLRPLPAAEAARPFANEPTRDFRHLGEQRPLSQALKKLAAAKPAPIGPLLNGQAARGEGAAHLARDPADPQVILGEGAWASLAQAEAAVQAAHAAWPSWAQRSVQDRAQILLQMAQALRKDRAQLTALLIREVGKPWRDADAEICEAIDFCEYYARQAIRELSVQRLQADIPGEINLLSHHGRGVAAVIAPWNFPVAILTGMTVAALVAGNTVVLKPAEQAPLCAARVVQLALKAGLPGEVLQLVPGLGEEIGAYLVRHPLVLSVAFTGSRAVGLEILSATQRIAPGQRGLKRVICEMGGKNPMIIDDDADLDEAVLGVVQSAFGFAGQKCSAASRVIVLESVHDHFVQRLVGAAQALRVGAPAEAQTQMGPVIDTEAADRLEAAIAEAQRAGAQLRAGGLRSGPGHFIAPTIFTGVDPRSALAREELFGPVLAVFSAPNFEAAVGLANDTDYALTAGLYSRDPEHLRSASQRLRAGNVYLNRSITGAIVGRQPFGGYGFSGTGPKAGGPGYLQVFSDARALSENTQRRGFAPEEA